MKIIRGADIFNRWVAVTVEAAEAMEYLEDLTLIQRKLRLSWSLLEDTVMLHWLALNPTKLPLVSHLASHTVFFTYHYSHTCSTIRMSLITYHCKINIGKRCHYHIST